MSDVVDARTVGSRVKGSIRTAGIVIYVWWQRPGSRRRGTLGRIACREIVSQRWGRV
jgi:hypothetical protein